MEPQSPLPCSEEPASELCLRSTELGRHTTHLRWPIHVRVWLGELDSGAGLGLISPHTHEHGDPHTDEFGSLKPEPNRTREPDSYVYGPL
jgi:hypothetical protein